jgi:diacylglycerol kinase (CTP)
MQGTSKEGSVYKIVAQESFKKKSDVHLARKVWHISGVMLLFIGYEILPETASKIGILLLFCLFVGIDLYRLRDHGFNVLITHYLRPIMRQSEIDHLAGTTYLMAGVAILIHFFDPIIIKLSLIFLALADPIASYFGIRYGKDKIWGEKTLQGFLAGFFVCSACSFLFLYLHDYNLWRAAVVSFIGGLVGSLAELIPVAKMDDNLTIPVASGVGLSLVFYIFGFI